MSSPQTQGIIIILPSMIGFIWSAVTFYNGLKAFRFKRIVENTPTSKVRSIAMGFVEVYGEAVLFGEKLMSPLSKNDCVYYKYKVREERGSGKNRYWVTLEEGESKSPFYLKDETGQVLIDPAGAKIDIPKGFQFRSGTLSGDPPKTVMEFLNLKGIKHDGLFGFNKGMSFEEIYIAPGDKLYILGTAGKNQNPEDLKSTTHQDSLIIQKGQRNFYYISDRPEYKIRNHLSRDATGVYMGGIMGILFLGLIFFVANIL